jgi:hypothetical protein
MPTLIIPEKICSHCGGNKWYFAPKNKTYECFIKVSERKMKWQNDNHDRYIRLAKERRHKLRELNPLQPRSKMSDDERRAKQREYKKKKYLEDPIYREQTYNRAKEYYQLHIEEKKQYNKQYGIKNADTIREVQRIGANRLRDKLANSYLKFLIIQGTDISQKDVPQDLVELKRKQILLTRQIRNHEENKDSINQ